MSKVAKIDGTAEAWENGELGLSEENARVSESMSGDQLDDLLGLSAIKVKVDRELIEILESLAAVHGVEFDALVRDQLQRFANAESKRLVTQYTCALKKESVESELHGDQVSDPDDPPRKRA